MRKRIVLALIAVICSNLPVNALRAQDIDPRVRRLIEEMTIEERVGQLFIVTFVGSNVSPDSEIGRLILDYKVGGLLLSPGNSNFTNEPDAPVDIAKITARLQTLALRNDGPGIPLFIALEHDGNGYPTTWLREGMTAVPSPMALGATWNPENAQIIGEIVGHELSTIGVNLLLGPPLDVLHTPRPSQPGDLKTGSFGGSPYWVGQMGQAYIRGVHEGSQGRVATVAKHFPGYGSSDRDPDQEAATVDKSLEEMSRTDLMPFFAVTDLSNPERDHITDGMMTSHLRYRGLQGSGRPGSPPISFDPGGLQLVMNLPRLAPWRKEGLLVSDSLGVPSIRRYFSPSLETFPYKEIAQKALLAGNDLLLLSRFALQDDDWPAQLANMTSTIKFFREQYKSDDTFRRRVDEALVRILGLKFKLYPRFTPELAAVDQLAVSKEVGQRKSDVVAIAQGAITLIAPSVQELADRIPTAPRSGEQILIFTDAREGLDCPECDSFPVISPTAIEDAILHLYGPDVTGQINPEEVHSLTYTQLKGLLMSPEEESAQAGKSKIPPLSPGEKTGIEELIQEATWIIFAMQDINPDTAPASDALRMFLKERPDSLASKKIIVLAYGAPYYLDATEISKLTAYYGVFSKIPAFIEASVRVLFQAFPPAGALPVSVRGITYDLAGRLQPDPKQTITLSRVDSESSTVNVGSEFTIQTSVILDKNGHPVPDGTKVTFWLTDPTDSTYLAYREVPTTQGIAQTTLLAERPGPVEIRAESAEAQTAEPLVLTLQGEVALTPTPEPPTPMPSPVPPTATPSLSPVERPPSPEPPPVGWGALMLSMLGMVVAGVIVASVGNGTPKPLPRGLRLFLVSLATGLVGYLAVGLGWLEVRKLPVLASMSSQWHAPLVSFAFALGPLAWVLWGRWQKMMDAELNHF